jgi:putative spermidine/putrescine transport system ATP-binding protein
MTPQPLTPRAPHDDAAGRSPSAGPGDATHVVSEAPGREPDLELDSVEKYFGDLHAVRSVSLVVEKGEFVSLLGPSGCGKTTTLSMIAGFQTLSSGRILLAGTRIDHLPPEKRNTGMVFQNYALFPHMNVTDNVGFGLRMRGIPVPERAERVVRALEMVQMGGYGERMPSQLSGGQQQRIALARALVIEPSMLLLDEPFGALDRQLRENMQVELRQLQQRLGITTVFVTHDQDEALSMSDRLAVMNQGVIEQIGAPSHIYEWPATEFVAGFIGKSNVFPATVAGREGEMLVLDTPAGHVKAMAPVQTEIATGSDVRLMIRPEKLRVWDEHAPPMDNLIDATVRQVVYHGAVTQLHVEPYEGANFLIDEANRVSQPHDIAVDSGVKIGWNATESRLFHEGRYAA